MNKQRKRREPRLHAALRLQQDFLIRRLGEDWDTLERGAKREEIVRRAKTGGVAVGKTLLALLAIAGTLTVAAVAPNVLGVIGRQKRKRRFFHQLDFQHGIKYLKRWELIRVRKSQDQYLLELTERGVGAALTGALRNLRARHRARWDGVWRVVLFDIPNSRAWARDAFRGRLLAMGFHRMQKSAFVYPYPCTEEIRFLISLFDVGGQVRFIETPHLTDDADLKRVFSL